jgi:hypoxanthine phosphoribosyltransferase
MSQEIPPVAAGHLWVGWPEYHRAIEELAALVHASGWQFDQILCLARGGLRPGDVLSRIFDVPLAILSTSSYREKSGTEQGELNIASAVTMARGALGGRVLLVDDLVDSGVTLQRVQQHLQQTNTAITEVRSAVIWYKQCSVLKPDFYLHYLPDNPWIHQPFEQYDGLRAEQLGAWMKKGRIEGEGGAG